MTSLVTNPLSAFPRLATWIENPWPFSEHNPVRIEEAVEDGHYLLRAELPGFDPEKDITITAHDGLLTINAEREEKQRTDGRSEFRYGSFSRTISLPAGADLAKIHATYTAGILEVSMPYSATQPDKHVKIDIAKK